MTTTGRTPSGSPSSSGRPKAAQNSAQVEQPEDRKAMSVSWSLWPTAMARASPSGVTPAMVGAETDTFPRKRRADGERYRGRSVAIDVAAPVAGVVPVEGRVADAGTEVVERLQDVGVAPEQSGDQYRQQCDHQSQDDDQCDQGFRP